MTEADRTHLPDNAVIAAGADTAASRREASVSPEPSGRKELRTAFIYLVISVVLAAAGAVYEHFSFGVYSNYMIYAFAIPLVGGAMTYLVSGIMYTSGEADAEGERTERGSNAPGGAAADRMGALIRTWFWHAAVATLTAGSIMQGILSICGRPNSLTAVYPAAAVLLLAAGAVAAAGGRRRTPFGGGDLIGAEDGTASVNEQVSDGLNSSPAVRDRADGRA